MVGVGPVGIAHIFLGACILKNSSILSLLRVVLLKFEI